MNNASSQRCLAERDIIVLYAIQGKNRTFIIIPKSHKNSEISTF